MFTINQIKEEPIEDASECDGLLPEMEFPMSQVEIKTEEDINEDLFSQTGIVKDSQIVSKIETFHYFDLQN